MVSALRPFIARAVAVILAWIVAHFAVGAQLDGTAQQALGQSLVNIICEILAIYSVFHRIGSKLTNSGDAASSHLAAVENEQVKIFKEEEQGI